MDNQLNEFYTGDRFNNERDESAYNEFMAYWATVRDVSSDKADKISENLHNQIVLHEFSKNEKSVKIFLDQTRFRILYATENVVDVLGYTAEEMLKYNTALFFRCLTFNHAGFIIRTTKKAFKIFHKVTYNDYVQNLSIIICGVKIKKKDRSVIQILMKYTPLEIDDRGLIQTVLITFEDVSHLLKSDFYWGRWSLGEHKQFKFHFLSNKKTEITHDIISDREKEVLRLIAQGLDSQEIGNQLLITKGTVDNHRKNMIARTGARDTTALVQLCLSCDII